MNENAAIALENHGAELERLALQARAQAARIRQYVEHPSPSLLSIKEAVTYTGLSEWAIRTLLNDKTIADVRIGHDSSSQVPAVGARCQASAVSDSGCGLFHLGTHASRDADSSVSVWPSFGTSKYPTKRRQTPDDLPLDRPPKRLVHRVEIHPAGKVGHPAVTAVYHAGQLHHRGEHSKEVARGQGNVLLIEVHD